MNLRRWAGPGGSLLLGGAGLLACSHPRERTPQPGPEFINVEVATVGVGESGTPVVLLQVPGSDRTMPIWVGLSEAHAINRSLQGIEEARPMTHDLLAEMTRQLGGTVEEVRVSDARDGIYFGIVKVKVRGERTPHEIDARPSDALALALRTGAPIRVRRDLLEAAPQITFVPPGTREQVVRALGLTVVAPSPELRRAFDLPDRAGVVVIRAAGAAEGAGLRRGDLIVEVNGKAPTKPIEFLDAVRATPQGAAVHLRYWREGAEASVNVPRPAPDPRLPPRPEIRT